MKLLKMILKKLETISYLLFYWPLHLDLNSWCNIIKNHNSGTIYQTLTAISKLDIGPYFIKDILTLGVMSTCCNVTYKGCN